MKFGNVVIFLALSVHTNALPRISFFDNPIALKDKALSSTARFAEGMSDAAQKFRDTTTGITFLGNDPATLKDRALSSATEFVQHVSETAQKFCEAASEPAAKALCKAKEQIYAVKYEELPEEVLKWIQEHPYQTAFYVVSGVVFFAPELLTTPLLYMLGWTSVGPKAGTLASAVQAAAGNVPAKGAFAVVQSAQMGGSGATIVAGVTRVAAFTGGALGIWNTLFGEKKQG